MMDIIPYILKTCPVCGKEFKCYDCEHWAYYRKVKVGDKYFKQLLCSYHCMPATGILNENKYSTEKMIEAQRVSYIKNKDQRLAYQKAYRSKKAKEKYAKNKVEIRARANAKYNEKTPEAEARRAEHVRKQRERRHKKAMERLEEKQNGI